MNDNLYSVLELENYALSDKIKAKYKEMIARHHPDKGGKAEDFQRIKEAYEYLKDEGKKKEYDRMMQYEEEAYEKAAEVFIHNMLQFQCFQCGGFNQLNKDLLNGFQMNKINITKCEHCSMSYKIIV